MPRDAPIIVVIFMLGALEMLAPGILGEHPGDVHLKINRKPHCAVQEVVAAQSNEQRDEVHAGLETRDR